MNCSFGDVIHALIVVSKANRVCSFLHPAVLADTLSPAEATWLNGGSGTGGSR